jgi:hypothetical protein
MGRTTRVEGVLYGLAGRSSSCRPQTRSFAPNPIFGTPPAPALVTRLVNKVGRLISWLYGWKSGCFPEAVSVDSCFWLRGTIVRTKKV